MLPKEVLFNKCIKAGVQWIPAAPDEEFYREKARRENGKVRKIAAIPVVFALLTTLIGALVITGVMPGVSGAGNDQDNMSLVISTVFIVVFFLSHYPIIMNILGAESPRDARSTAEMELSIRRNILGLSDENIPRVSSKAEYDMWAQEFREFREISQRKSDLSVSR